MANDKDLLQVVRLLDDACREAGFFYVVITRLLTFLASLYSTMGTDQQEYFDVAVSLRCKLWFLYYYRS